MLNRSKHRVGEWQRHLFLVPTLFGTLPVPVLATDEESAEKCVRLSLALLARQMTQSRQDTE